MRQFGEYALSIGIELAVYGVGRLAGFQAPAWIHLHVLPVLWGGLALFVLVQLLRRKRL